MLSGTRASLSTDAKVDFLSVRVADPRLGSSITLLRYVPDIKGILIYMRYSRDDFEDRRLVIEPMGRPIPTRLRKNSTTSPCRNLWVDSLHRACTANSRATRWSAFF
jgi:hypothetical protein